MNDATKSKMAFWSFVPLAAFLAWCAYLMAINGGLIEHKAAHEHEKVVSLIAHNYGGSLILFTVAFIIGLGVLVYFIVHLARIKEMTSGTKLGWIIFMSVFGPFAFPVFYFLEIRQEQDDLKLYPSIE